MGDPRARAGHPIARGRALRGARARARVVVPYTLEMEKSPRWRGKFNFYISAQNMDFEINMAFFGRVILFDAGGARAYARARVEDSASEYVGTCFGGPMAQRAPFGGDAAGSFLPPCDLSVQGRALPTRMCVGSVRSI